MHRIKYYFIIFLVGIVAGFGAIIFRDLIALFHNLFFYGQFSTNYNVLIHSAKSHWGVGIILVPVIGSFIVTFLIDHFAPEAKGHGVPEAMDAIYFNKGIIRPVVAVVKALASSITIGSGGSVGREGPIIQIGAAFGSTIAQITNLAVKERIILIACGAGGGIAATFNTPMGGILFAIEIMLPLISIANIVPIIIATAIATTISRMALGNTTFLPKIIATTSVLNFESLLILIIFSLFLGFFAMIFIRLIYYVEDLFDDVFRNNYVKHGLGMLLVGINIYLCFQFLGHYYVEGVGYATIMDILGHQLNVLWILLLLAVLKILSTAITLGSGGSGGIFSPLLFIGATLGGGFSLILSMIDVNASLILPVDLGALVGMAAMVGASTAAPITAIIMLVEMTQDFQLILPAMLVVGLAYGIRYLLLPDSIYTLKLSRRGHHIPQYFPQDLL